MRHVLSLRSILTLTAVASISALSLVGCANYGGSVPIDTDAGMIGNPPPGSVDASVPIDDDVGVQKDNAPKP